MYVSNTIIKAWTLSIGILSFLENKRKDTHWSRFVWHLSQGLIMFYPFYFGEFETQKKIFY
jgi:hypothetical protein